MKINGFEWITGSSMEDLTSGEWQYHDPSITTGSDNFIKVEWSRTSNTDGRVKFLNNSDNSELTDKKGDYIEYIREGNDIEVNFYDIKYGDNDEGGILDMKVYWNIDDKTGGIKYNDGSQVTSTETSINECEWDPAT